MMCTNNHASHAGRPLRCMNFKSATALFRPIVAIVPLSNNGRVVVYALVSSLVRCARRGGPLALLPARFPAMAVRFDAENSPDRQSPALPGALERLGRRSQ